MFLFVIVPRVNAREGHHVNVRTDFIMNMNKRYNLNVINQTIKDLVFGYIRDIGLLIGDKIIIPLSLIRLCIKFYSCIKSNNNLYINR